MSDNVIDFKSASSWKMLLRQVLERDDIEAVVLVINIDDRWYTAFPSVPLSRLSEAALILHRDVTDLLEH